MKFSNLAILIPQLFLTNAAQVLRLFFEKLILTKILILD